MEQETVNGNHGVSGLITNIQHFSVHDGPGIRTLVFLKGCPLRCLWCCNPETQEFRPEIGIVAERCHADCSSCRDACPSDALCKTASGVMLPRAERCRECVPLKEGNPPCVSACPYEAVRLYGTRVDVRDVLDEVERDIDFYRHGNGGMTLSGGEALAQADFALALLREAKERCIHSALETCGFVPAERLLEACSLTDYLLFDVKIADTARHEHATGVSNACILENLRLVRKHFPRLPIRVCTPVIPGVNAASEDIQAIGEYLAGLGGVSWELLPYHAFGTVKYAGLGRPCRNFTVPDRDCMKRLEHMAENFVRAAGVGEYPESGPEPFTA